MATPVLAGGARRAASPSVSLQSPTLAYVSNRAVLGNLANSLRGGQGRTALGAMAPQSIQAMQHGGGNVSANASNAVPGISAETMGTIAAVLGAMSVAAPAMAPVAAIASIAANAAQAQTPQAAVSAFAAPAISMASPQAAQAMNVANSIAQSFAQQSVAPVAATAMNMSPIGQVANSLSSAVFGKSAPAALAAALSSPTSAIGGAGSGGEGMGLGGATGIGGLGGLGGVSGEGTALGSIGSIGDTGFGLGAIGEGTALGSIGSIGSLGSAADAGAAGADGGSGAKIICTKLYQLGIMPETIYRADQDFGYLLAITDPAAYHGYIRWAKYVVAWMDRKDAFGRFTIAVTKRIAMPWAYAMAEQMGVLGVQSSWFGRQLLVRGLEFCRLCARPSAALV